MGAGIPLAAPAAGDAALPSAASGPVPPRGFYSSDKRNVVGGSKQCCPCAAVPRCAMPCHPSLPTATVIIPGSNPCGSCSSPGPTTPGAPPLPAGRERCQGCAGSILGCRGPLGAALVPAQGTYPLLIHHDVVAPVLLGQVRGQDVKAPPELRKHHVVRVPCGSKGDVGAARIPRGWPGAALCALTCRGPSFGRADGVIPRGTSTAGEPQPSPGGSPWLCPPAILARIHGESGRILPQGSAGTRVLLVQANRLLPEPQPTSASCSQC